MVYSWNDMDPAGNNPNAAAYHGMGQRGTQSINLLGGLQDPRPDPSGFKSFVIKVNDVRVLLMQRELSCVVRIRTHTYMCRPYTHGQTLQG